MRATAMNFFKRLREPSTMAGLSALALLFGTPAGTVDLLTQVLGGVAAAGAILLPEGKAD
jgi:hypothetical protein